MCDRLISVSQPVLTLYSCDSSVLDSIDGGCNSRSQCNFSCSTPLTRKPSGGELVCDSVTHTCGLAISTATRCAADLPVNRNDLRTEDYCRCPNHWALLERGSEGVLTIVQGLT